MKKTSKTGTCKLVAGVEIMIIEPPKYYIGRFTFNEYEIRNLLADVAESIKPWGMILRDEYGNKWRILADGRMEPVNHHESCPAGWDYTGNSMIRILRSRKLNDQSLKK